MGLSIMAVSGGSPADKNLGFPRCLRFTRELTPRIYALLLPPPCRARGICLAKKRLGYGESTGDRIAMLPPVPLLLGRVSCLSAGCCGAVQEAGGGQKGFGLSGKKSPP